MSKTQKIKRVVIIAIGFGLSTYLLINGFALLEQENQQTIQKGIK